MRFDQTFIGIRERPTLEIYDLATHVIVDHLMPLLRLFLLGVAPWILLDFWMLGWMLSDQYSPYVYAAYFWAMLCLIISQSQLGTCLLTVYLGKAMFVGRPSVLEVIRETWSAGWYYGFAQGILRTALFSFLICLLFQGESEETFLACYLLLTASVFAGLLVRAFRPYITEILLLEKTPIREKGEGTITFGIRSRSLHSFASNDLFGKFIVSVAVNAALFLCLHCMFVWADSILNIRANSDFSLQPYYAIAAAWMVAGFACVVRFLSYIDLRIRLEGWAVELRMRAESQRLLQSTN